MAPRRASIGQHGRRALLCGAAALLAGCGFRLRQAPELAFQRLHLSGFRYDSGMAEALRQALRSGTGARLMPGPDGAQVILEALAETTEKSVVADTGAGQVRELQLRARLRFRVRTPGGKELIPATELLLTRDMSYNEKDALAKEQEEEQLYRAMMGDIAMQVLHRLAAIKEL